MILHVAKICMERNNSRVTTTHVTAGAGLRERKKRATRRALRGAALRLAATHGVDQVTVEAIGQEAGVSTRTFFNYFGSKEEALVGDGAELQCRISAALEAASDQPLLSILRRALHDAAVDVVDMREEMLLRKRLLSECPALLPQHMANFAAAERAIAEAVAEHLGVGVESELRPKLVAATVTTVARVTFQHWHGGSDAELDALIDEAFDRLQLGL